MSLSNELQEAVDLDEDIHLLLANLSEDTAFAIDSEIYTDEILEDVFSAIYKTYDLSEEDLPEIEAAISEFVDEHWDEEDAEILSERKAKAKAKEPEKKPGLISKALSWVAKQAAGHLEKGLKGVKADKGTAKHALVHAARGALKQYSKGKGGGKEIAKKAATKLVTKTAKKAIKKGMKMVFGRMVKVGTGKSVASAKQAPPGWKTFCNPDTGKCTAYKPSEDSFASVGKGMPKGHTTGKGGHSKSMAHAKTAEN